MKENFDAIIIGSGIGGLTAATHLANQNKNVIILESAREFGGYINPFKRGKFHFDVGVHYLSGLNPGQVFHEILNKLNILETVKFNSLPQDCFDRYIFPELEFCMPVGHRAFQEKLEKLFPEAKAGISSFMTILNGIGNNSLPHNFVMGTYGTFLDQLFGDNNLIKAVLSGPCGNLGLPPGKLSALMMFTHIYSLLEGVFYPQGSGGALKNAFINILKEKGAVLKNRSAVKKILVEKNKVCGALVENDDEYRAPVIICNADPTFALTNLIDEKHLDPRHVQQAAQTKPSISSICLYLGTDVPRENMNLGAENVWHYPSLDIDGECLKLESSLPKKDFRFFLSCISQKSPDSGLCPAGTEILEMIVYYPYEPFRKWKGQKSKKRSPDYVQLKEQIKSNCIAELERLYVKGLSKHLLVSELSTPLTNEYFVSAREGGIIGPAHTPEQIGPGRFKIQGPLANLYFCGAGIYSGGVSPSCVSGYEAAELALKNVDN